MVLVIADHGEAFGEHGSFGHSLTVYEETIRVPFILRVPPGRIPDTVDLSRLVSLADVAPTLLGLAGVRPVDGLDGIDLFDRSFEERRADRCVIVSSGASRRLTYAVRTERWKVIVRELHQRDLYDVGSDPSETADLSGKYPELTAGLAHLVVESLRRPRATEAAGPIGAAEKEALRALGYIMD